MKLTPLLLASALLVSIPTWSAVAIDAPQAPKAPGARQGDGDGQKGEHPRRPHIGMTIHALEGTLKHLQAAKTDLGGHRDPAIKACEQALAELRAIAKLEREKHGPQEGGHKRERPRDRKNSDAN